jgi:predicted AlkP superfamily phosphohydrolase/phosphomutase
LTEVERPALEDTLHRVYMAADQAVGEIVAAAGEDVTIMVMSMHGMGVNNSRTWIFPDMLKRVLGTQVERSPVIGLVNRLRALVPVEWRHGLKSRLPYHARRWLTRTWRTSGFDWPRTRAFNLFSDTQGWVRINLKGREAGGVVEPGEYDALCEQISEGLKTFVDADTGEPVVKSVLRPHQAFEGERLADLPDLIVNWAESPAALHREIVSPQFGRIAWPTPGHNPEGRSGNHRWHGFLITAGPGVKTGRIDGAHLLDLAPTILSLLGQPVPAGMEGKVLSLFNE